eukprot:CAMPEP_0202704724 /NCGR_PEP_ID=MMETSP1385-20130828/17362_1 /ASSEMBLY_ACC=CAM_ASM_000861 /TAXON_ID=933848 /ORGANISM="Elphidium margaritaceum" /LENGTH=292 /DNA_ID=CAMNT_0049362813 /DNA_START=151 /DNA_END=1026 /DNA_ORIENTATION=-
MDSISFLPIIQGKKIERTQATYYTSDLYPKPLTPEHILGASNYWQIERGQIQYPLNRWTQLDGWYMTNHWIHRMADKYILGLFGWWVNGLHDVTIDDQPYPQNYLCRRNPYDDDIPGQVAGGILVGMQVGAIFGVHHIQNTAYEAGIYQSIGMPPNRWLPLHKATYGFRARIVMTCMAQSASFLGAYALADGIASQLRGTDDFWNPFIGGLAAGTTLWAWYSKPHTTIPAGIYFGAWMAWFRFMLVPDSTRKTCLDFNRPGWGVVGGLPLWIAGEEPSPDTVWYRWLDKKYW